MKNKGFFTEFLITFLVITACVTIMEGVLGMIFLPDMRFGFEAFLSPPLFGFLTALTGIVTKSTRELSRKQILFRELLQLLLIEALVFGVNHLVGATYEARLKVALAAAIALVFVAVYLVIWLNDRRSARLFNEKLKEFQEEMRNLDKVC